MPTSKRSKPQKQNAPMESFKPSKKRCRSIQTQGDMETNKASLKLQINARFRGVRQIIDLNQTTNIISNIKAHFYSTKSEAERLLHNFDAKGGVIIQPTQKQVFRLLKDDIVFPVCHSGFNRSQVLFKVLKDITSIPMKIQNPHGCFNGFDPRFKQAPNYIPIPDKVDESIKSDVDYLYRDAFFLAFGHHRQPKFGYNQCDYGQAIIASQYPVSDKEVIQNRNNMVDYFSNHYYSSPNSRSQRRVFICFNKAVESLIERLYLLVKQRESRLDNVVVIALPIDDYCKARDTLKLASIYRKLYDQLSDLFVV